MNDAREDSTESQHRAKWPNYQERDRQIQKHLADVQTLIEDAARIVGHSLLDNASAEEKTDTYALHDRFHELNEIIRRRMQRNYSPNDGEQWSVIVAGIRSLVRRESLLRLMSKEINIAEGVGKAARYVGQTNLAHLIDQLPTKLPGDKTEKQTKEQKRAEKDKQEMERLLKRPAPESVRSRLSMLTDIQRQVATLRWGYFWSIARIARAMSRDRKTITRRSLGPTRT